MRYRISCVALVLLPITLIGCAGGPLARREPVQTPVASSSTEVVAQLNENSRRINSLDCANASINVTQGSQRVGLRADLAFHKPRNFRMQAYAAGSTQADMGSNDREFWFWIKQGDPYLFHCSYDDLAQARSVPIQPDWLIEGMGISELGDPGEYQMTEDRSYLVLSKPVNSPQGMQLTKVIRIHKTGRYRNLIHSQYLLGQDRQPIWYSEIQDYQSNPQGVIIPRKVELRNPQEKVTISVNLRQCDVNTLTADRIAPQLFTRPHLRGVESFDLARGGPARQPIQRIRGQSY